MSQVNYEELVDKYVLLEDQFNYLTEKIKGTRNKEAQRAMRAKKKELRLEQGQIFVTLNRTGWTRAIEERLGLGANSKALKRRAKRKGLL